VCEHLYYHAQTLRAYDAVADRISNPSARHFSAGRGLDLSITFIYFCFSGAGGETGANRCLARSSRDREVMQSPQNAFCALSTHRAVIDDELVSCAVPNLHLHKVSGGCSLGGLATTFI
jgi:hypothetical protein